MRESLSDNYPLGLICVTVFLIVSDMLVTNFTELGGIWAVTVTIFIGLGSLGVLATSIRTIFPKVRNSVLYQILMLFDVTSLLQIIRRNMNQAGRTRQAAMVGGTLFYGMSLFLLITLFTSGISVMNIDNGLWGYAPPLSQEITVGSLIMLVIFLFVFVTSMQLIAFGFYNYDKWDSVKEFARSLSRKPENSQEPDFWKFMNKKQKRQYVLLFGSFFALLCLEVAALGFIMLPAHTFGTSMEGEATARVLGVFGTMTNLVLADIGVLSAIGVTAWGSLRLSEKLESSAVRQ